MPDQEALAALFAPRRAAVVGASRHPGKLGAVMSRSLARATGGVALINSRRPEPEQGIHASVAAAVDAGGPIDFAAICVPAPACPSVVRELGAAGVRAALICAGGFAETGGEGAALEAELRAAGVEAGVRLLGPNTSGFVVPGRRLVASFVPGMAGLTAGSIAVVAASGGVHHATAFLLAARGHGVSLGVGLGNAVDVTAADVLGYLRGHDETAAVALHVESVADGGALMRAVAELAARRPVAALVVGRNDVRDFALSHTGALATSWRATRAALRQAGAVLVDDERQLADAVIALSRARLRPSPKPGVALVTAQAGPGLIALDGLTGRGVHVPPLNADTRERLTALLPPLTYQANPVDTGRPGPEFSAVLDATAADPEVDLVGVYALLEPEVVDLPKVIRGRSEAAPAVVSLGGMPGEVAAAMRDLADLGVPAVEGPTALVSAMAALVDDAVARHRLGSPLPHAPIPDLGGFAEASDWDEHQTKEALAALGIKIPAARRCRDLDQALRALADLRAPVAAKILRPVLAHKTDAGGVHLNLRTEAEMAAAWPALRGIGAEEVLVEEMAAGGVDLVVGARRDAVFGPLVLLGLGGTAAEVLADVAIRVAPLSRREAESMVEDLAGRALLDGHRGLPVVDVPELAGVLTVLGAVLTAHPDIEDLEINPLRATPTGLYALDALIIHTQQKAGDS